MPSLAILGKCSEKSFLYYLADKNKEGKRGKRIEGRDERRKGGRKFGKKLKKRKRKGKYREERKTLSNSVNEHTVAKVLKKS